MKIQSVKQINVTVLFPEPLNHNLISIKELNDQLKDSKPSSGQDRNTVVEGPGLKVLVFIDRKKEIVYEQNRLLINDKEVPNVTRLGISPYLDRGFEQTRQDRKKIAAYGFNFDAIVLGNGEKAFVDGKILKAIKGKVEEQGAKVVFRVNTKRYDFQLTPAGSPREIIAHLNIHYAKDILPENNILRNQIQEDFKEFQGLVKKL